MNRAVSRLGVFLLAIGCLAVVGCTGFVGVPVTVDQVDDVETYYDDPVQGWYVDGYWAGGCLNCGLWVAPFWTRDVVVLHQHWPYYHGYHRVYLERHFVKYGGHGRYDHRRYQHGLRQQHERRQQEMQRHERQQQRYQQQQQRQQQRYEQRQDNREQRQEHRQERREQREERRQERRHRK